MGYMCFKGDMWDAVLAAALRRMRRARGHEKVYWREVYHCLSFWVRLSI